LALHDALPIFHERTMDGLAAAAAQGRTGGRPSAVDADTLAVARARRTRGESVTSIASHLGVGRSTLYRALQHHHQDQSTAPIPAAEAPAPSQAASPTSRACPTCVHEPFSRPESVHLRFPLDYAWPIHSRKHSTDHI